MPSARILLLCVAAAVFYGEVHDQFTIRVCLEYFTVAHPPVMIAAPPTLLALYWGYAATWWVGVLLGLPLAFACRAGKLPRLSAGQLVRPISILLLGMFACALVSGVTGFLLVSHGVVSVGNWAEVIPPRLHARFFADVYAHLASYAVGFLGGIVVILWAVRQRHRIAAAGVS